mmetsp:Transcript_6986/g.21267  ORF Transcript_6986/g.21267 Transcript_6986/m.21267 type:complete len:232 (+) Transcript_6986:1632-2327(+)
MRPQRRPRVRTGRGKRPLSAQQILSSGISLLYSGESKGADARDPYGNKLPAKPLNITLEIRQAVGSRAPTDLRGNLCISLHDEHLLHSIQVPLISRKRVHLIPSDDLVKSLLFHLLVHLGLHHGSRRCGSRRIGGSVYVIKLHLLHEPQRILKLLVSFARKPDDGVRGNRCIGNFLPNLPHNLAVPLDRIASVHGPENVTVPALKRHVEVLADLGQLCARTDQPLRKIARM